MVLKDTKRIALYLFTATTLFLLSSFVAGHIALASVVSYSRTPSGDSIYNEVTFSVELDSYTTSCPLYDPDVDGWQIQMAIDVFPFEIYSDVALGNVLVNDFVWDFYDDSYDISQDLVDWGTTETVNINQIIVNCRYFGGGKDDIEGLEYTGSTLFTAELYVPPPPPVLGCTDPEATNYNPLATEDDGSCEYPPPTPTTTNMWGSSNGFWGTTTATTINGTVQASVVLTGQTLWPMLKYLGIPIAFVLAFWLVSLINKELSPVTPKIERRRKENEKEDFIYHSAEDLEFMREYGRKKEH